MLKANSAPYNGVTNLLCSLSPCPHVQGRVLFDVILYSTGDNTILLECDLNATTDVIKHLKKYALRSKV